MKTLKTIGIIIIVVLSIFAITGIVSNYLEQKSEEALNTFIKESSIKKEENSLKEIEQSIRIMKNRLPFTDYRTNMTTYDIVLNKEIKTVTYKYIDKTQSRSQLTSSEISNYKSQWRNNTLAVTKDNENSKSFKNAEITLIYNLIDKDSLEILEFQISPSEY